MEKQISIIIPMFNVENYIGKCLDSILNQTIDNYEIIIVDDGSTDLSSKIAAEYQTAHPDIIKLFNQENLGQASARNYGLKKANGKYISFIDSDDYIHPEMLEILLNEIEDNDLDIIQCGYINFFEDSSKDYPYLFNVNSEKIYNGKEYFEFGPSLSPCDKIYSKQFLDNIDFKFKEGYYAEDVLEISKVLFFADRIKFIQKNLYFYRRNSYNSTRNSVSLIKSIKLGRDKVYIASELNDFRDLNKWKGMVNIIIIRNILGAIVKKEILNLNYRKEIFRELKKRKALKIIIDNLTFSSLYKIFYIGFSKIILNKDC